MKIKDSRTEVSMTGYYYALLEVMAVAVEQGIDLVFPFPCYVLAFFEAVISQSGTGGDHNIVLSNYHLVQVFAYLALNISR